MLTFILRASQLTWRPSLVHLHDPPPFALNPMLYALPHSNSPLRCPLDLPAATCVEIGHDFDLLRRCERIRYAVNFSAESIRTGRVGLHRVQKHARGWVNNCPHPFLSKFRPSPFGTFYPSPRPWDEHRRLPPKHLHRRAENPPVSALAHKSSASWSPAAPPPQNIGRGAPIFIAVLEAGHLRAAKRRAQQKDDEGAKARAREASTRYRAENHEELALKQRKVRKQAFIKKHGVHAYIQRRFDAPIPSREVDEEDDADDDHQGVHDDDYRYNASAAPLICDYNDPFLKRCRSRLSSHARAHLQFISFALDILAWKDSRLGLDFLDSVCQQIPPPSLSSSPQPDFPKTLLLDFKKMPCTPPFYPSPGHESRNAHDRSSVCYYYQVCVGWFCGVFTNSWLARVQTDGFSNSHCKAVKSWEDVLAYCDEFCSKNHGDGCPAFKPIDFSLTPSESYPSPASCTHPPRAAAAPPAPAAPPTPIAPPSPFASYTSSMGSTSTSSLLDSECTSASLPTLASPTPQKAPLSPFPKKEESAGPNAFFTGPRVTPNTLIVLSPSGQARAATLAAASFLSSPAVAARRMATVMTMPRVPDNRPATPPPGPVMPGPAPVTPARAARPSVHATPRPGSVASTGPPVAAPRVRQYGIRGVAMFYPSHDAAKTAATKLGLVNAKIMVSDNPDKLEAWMTNQPFVGEDDE
ncbi:hypothetical protein B0H10DRAFT_2206220 [Mycena sp. CBHHK59/15]|nr:hypothetical protein B0H10DRAFT_2206220 [Mycena sp. CBHHK59/15]